MLNRTLILETFCQWFFGKINDNDCISQHRDCYYLAPSLRKALKLFVSHTGSLSECFDSIHVAFAGWLKGLQ